METLIVITIIVAGSIIAGIVIVTAGASLLLVQSAGASTNVLTTTTSVGGEQEASKITSTNTTNNNNNNSNAVLGRLFLTGEDRLTSFNPINKTYTKVSYAGNRTIMPMQGVTTTATINATEKGNLSLNLQPNGITLVEGKSILVSKGEKAIAMLVDLNGVRPNDPRSSTGVAFFSTNSTGRLAFLHNMIAIYQVKASPGGTAIRMWEWKGADNPFGNEVATATIENHHR